jgi:hypothetical protein
MKILEANEIEVTGSEAVGKKLMGIGGFVYVKRLGVLTD